MKDKRQKLSFPWPGYPGDPFSYFSYMYAAASSSSGYAPPPFPPLNPLAAAAVRLATTPKICTNLNGSTDTGNSSSSSASSPISSSSSPKQTTSSHSINFALPAMGLGSFLNNSVKQSTTN